MVNPSPLLFPFAAQLARLKKKDVAYFADKYAPMTPGLFGARLSPQTFEAFREVPADPGARLALHEHVARTLSRISELFRSVFLMRGQSAVSA